jgi:hypothetical protein
MEKVGKFVEREGEIAGETRIVRGWIGIGQRVCAHAWVPFCHLG